MEFQYFELTNGIRVVYKNIPAYVSHLGLIINAGSRDENNDEQGIAHFIEHVIFKGTEKRKAFHILSYMENVGGEINAYTSKEARYGAFCGCCSVHGGFKTQRLLRSRNFTRGRLFDNRRKPLSTPDRSWPGCG